MSPRGTFHDRYVFGKDAPERRPGLGITPRLLDLLKCHAPDGDAEYFEAPTAGEFAVVDHATGEKAWFDAMSMTPDQITGMVSSHFAATARRVAGRLWVV